MPHQLVLHSIVVIVKGDAKSAGFPALIEVPVVGDHDLEPVLDLLVDRVVESHTTCREAHRGLLLGHDKILAHWFAMWFHGILISITSPLQEKCLVSIN